MKVAPLYAKAFPSKRSGSLYSAFSYPTKISPEVIAVFIASHTKPGDVILDTFGGSGTTGLATMLCDNPTEEVIKLAEEMQAPVKWGARNAVIYELNTLGAFISETMCNPPDSELFLSEAEKLIKNVEYKLGWMYKAIDPEGNVGFLRHVIWSEVLECGSCGKSVSYWDNSVSYDPLALNQQFSCKKCGNTTKTSDAKRVTEDYYDELLNRKIIRKKRVIKKVYGQTGTKKWAREPIKQDLELLLKVEDTGYLSFIPVEEIIWGDLYRSGYHSGITHLHHFYTKRNLHIISTLWNQIDKAPIEVQDALKFLVLSYNSSHSTLMSRVVLKTNQKDFVTTGAQSGVLYISNLPVEKNILVGLKRKIKVMYRAFSSISDSKSRVEVVRGSSTDMKTLKNQSINYVFTDPPFGDYIPYTELSFLNEAWLGKITNNKKEVIVSNSQDKSIENYKELMEQVFSEISRVLTDDGKATVVFHSAKAEIWRALQTAYNKAGFKVSLSSVLDKLQGSFKQINSNIRVKGDPLLLLEKATTKQASNENNDEIEEQINNVMLSMKNNKETLTEERIYSRFINHCLENNNEVPINASEFYQIVRRLV